MDDCLVEVDEEGLVVRQDHDLLVGLRLELPLDGGEVPGKSLLNGLQTYTKGRHLDIVMERQAWQIRFDEEADNGWASSGEDSD